MVLGVNANNSCESGTDLIYLVFFKNIDFNTEFFISDNRWTGFNFGTNEGVMRVRRTGGTLTAGTLVKLDINNSGSGTSTGWAITKANTGNNFNIATASDQFLIWQGTWNDSGSITGSFKLGYNTKRDWNTTADSNNSRLPSDLICYHISSPISNLNFRHYQGPVTQISHVEWLVRILNSNNWINNLSNNATGCTNFNNFFNTFPNSIPIRTTIPSQEICSGEPLNNIEVVNETNVVNYQWYSNNAPNNTGGTLIPGATTHTFTPSNTTIGTTYYYCEMTISLPLNTGTVSNNECSFFSNVFQVTVNPNPATSPVIPL